MGEFYSYASEVVVWLGEEDSETQNAVDLLVEISRAVRVWDGEGELAHRKDVSYSSYKNRDR